MTMPPQSAQALLELANLYPSPHNGQPIKVKLTGENSLELYFEKERGLQSTDISFRFSFVSMGVFVEHLSLCARALGHTLTYKLDLPHEADLRGSGQVLFARCNIQWQAVPSDPTLEAALHFRQTSRKKYYEGVSTELAREVTAIADKAHMKLTQLDKAQTRQAIWLNQRAVFDDMFNEPVREELDHWLRYTRKQKEAKRDGLAYDCMELNGRAMRFIVAHPRILRMPGISRILREYYLRTMTDSSNVFYMLAPFGAAHDAFQIGVVVMDVWRAVAAAGYYLHPFGTIMSNHEAHRDFVKLAHIQDESIGTSYLVFIFRCGKSERPVPSLRLPVSEHMILE